MGGSPFNLNESPLFVSNIAKQRNLIHSIRRPKMKRIYTLMALGILSGCVLVIAPLKSRGAEGKPIVIYMQMGGDRGIASVLARTTGAEAAAKALGVELHEQYASWDTKKMIDQFKEAIAAKPDGIVIMGHPGEDA